MFDFNPRSTYHRRMWHYESDRPLSVAQLVALRSLDARTAALLWLLIEKHVSVIVSGPTDPTPGIGKTTTLNALLGFLPAGSTLAYTLGMYEDFAFRDEVTPETTCVLANEVSDHLRIYMWGRVARTFLRLPESGFAIATSCHADTIDDVLAMLRRDLRLPEADLSRLGVIINIGLVGRVWPPQRRFLTVNLLRPSASSEDLPAADAQSAPGVAAGSSSPGAARAEVLPLATWDATSDGFIAADGAQLTELAGYLSMSPVELCAAVGRRETRLDELAQGRGAGLAAMRAAVDMLAAEEASDAALPGDATPED